MADIAIAFGLVFQPYVLSVILLSAVFGLVVGAIPGLTATMATALLVPVTFFMPPVPAIAAIVTATAMAIFSGDIPGAIRAPVVHDPDGCSGNGLRQERLECRGKQGRAVVRENAQRTR